MLFSVRNCRQILCGVYINLRFTKYIEVRMPPKRTAATDKGATETKISKKEVVEKAIPVSTRPQRAAKTAAAAKQVACMNDVYDEPKKARKSLSKPKTTKPRKPKRKQSVSDDGDDSTEIAKPEPAKKSKGIPKKAATSTDEETKELKNKTQTNFKDIDYGCTKENKEGGQWDFKIASWNVDGIRAWLKKGCLEYIQHESPDVFCIQETKCSLDKLPDEVRQFDGYHAYWSAADKEGYSGVGLYSKIMPIDVSYGISDPEHDTEGRIITAEFKKFYIISVYVPNSGRGLVTMPKRMSWNNAFRKYIKKLDMKKPVIICGDMNVAHQEIDLKNPKTNKKTAGFTQEERDGMSEFLTDGYVDTFRKLYPDKEGVYTFWTFMSNSRAKNIGWRIDYFLVSERLMPKICDNVVRSEIYGSDHCPLVLYLQK